ncbi:hypothetical protein S7711_00240 [Stachybotrys chartarum IBT 7711]|uniref:Uncharacterized protein n=1 Tax=Stachybotrys chartarum (strain CBS 109288 / IBT 7711) TaxID=1280523 RepID=A0A084B3W2_STACB|nr:hypothetical protein S7711_00240 [Stachybotrys chartarum IBT 7711]KFA52297.1 hypothetical protein S40293_00636 [Stachybotrys chartarum IBT 40293]
MELGFLTTHHDLSRFPGCRCDSPAHVYAYSFNPNPQWSNVYAPAAEILEYLKDTARKYDCNRFIAYHKRVNSAIWSEERGQWQLSVVDVSTGLELDDSCHILVNASGVLSNWKWPELEGLERFKGQLMHPANWNESYDFAGKRVAVIGIGASAMQVLPQLAKIAKQVTLFARSPTWVAPQKAPQSPDEHEKAALVDQEMNYLPDVRQRFVDDPSYLQRHRRDLADKRLDSFKSSGAGRSPQKSTDERYRASMISQLGDSEKARHIAAHLIPSFPVGCRRITPGPGFLKALMRENVESVWGSICRVTETGIQASENGEHREFDVIVCATGFDYSYIPRFTLRGRNGADLSQRWRNDPPEAYLATAIAGFPNYFTFVGPNSPVANGGLVQGIQAQGLFIFKCITKLQVQGIRSMDVSKQAMDDYNVHTQAYLRDSVWATDCSSWYKRGDKEGQVVAVYAGSFCHFVEMMRTPRWEDFVFDYVVSRDSDSLNRFAYLGNGLTVREASNRSIGSLQTTSFEEYWNLMEVPSFCI